MTAVRLHQLLYYTQVRSLVWDKKALFHEEIEAWLTGACIPVLHEIHSDSYHLDTLKKGNSSIIEKDEQHSIDVVLDLYQGKSAPYLSYSIRSQSPWEEAYNREYSSSRVMTYDSILKYSKTLLKSKKE